MVTFIKIRSFKHACLLTRKKVTLLAREGANPEKGDLHPAGTKLSGGKVTFWKDITRKEVTENREKGDFRGTGTRKEVTLHPEKRGFIPRDTKPSNYPDKGDFWYW
jgi:hypothetical protein